jgi:hypothetical protein
VRWGLSRRIGAEERARPASAERLLDGRGRPLPTAAEPAVLALLGLTACLQIWVWSRVEGYELADSIEYLERALAWVRGEPMASDASVRSFAFSTLFMPLFGLARGLGMEDLRPLVYVARVVQMALGLALVLVCVRLGARLGDRRSGLAAGLAVAANPVFLLYSVSPVADIAAGLCVALALERLLEPGSFRTALGGGLWLGVAFLMAYKALLVVLAVGLAVLVRDRRRLAAPLGIGAGVSAAVGVQVVLDRIVYGEWGASVWRYAVDNFGSVLTKITLHMGLRDVAFSISRFQHELRGYDFSPDPTATTTRQLQPENWYVVHGPEFLVWPVLACFAIGLVAGIWRTRWKAGLFAVIFAVSLVAMSTKGAKDFRLWLPLLPAIAPLCGYGWLVLAGAGERSPAWRRGACALLLVGAIPLALRGVLDLEPRRHGAYWRALEMVERDAPPRSVGQGQASRPRVASAYHWAVFLRASPRFEMVKLPFRLAGWSKLSPEERSAQLGTLEDVDWLLVHLPLLTQDPALLAAVNERFEVHGALFDPETNAGIGPVFVLRRCEPRARGRTFFRRHAGEGAVQLTARADLGPPISFRREVDDSGSPAEGVTLVGWEFETLPGSDHGWITYHWRADTPLSREYLVMDRVTGPEHLWAWQNNHAPAYGAHSFRSLAPGELLSESYLLVPVKDAYLPRAPYRPIGGPWLRGDLIPASLWLAVIDATSSRRMRTHPAGSPSALEEHLVPRGPADLEGFRLSADGLIRIGRFYLPVPAREKRNF